MRAAEASGTTAAALAARNALAFEQLAEREDFYNVGQSGASTAGNDSSVRGERFSIHFNVSGIDFPAYEARYTVEP